MSSMATMALTASQWSHAPKLRLVPRKDDAPAAPAATSPGGRDLNGALLGTAFALDADGGDTSPVLVAGRDPASRASVIDGLNDVMPPHTPFQEAGTFWEVLVRAPGIRMVVLSDELDGVPTESLLHMLGHRHPGLPVVSLDAQAPRDGARSER
jgi:hypothetical protein